MTDGTITEQMAKPTSAELGPEQDLRLKDPRQIYDLLLQQEKGSTPTESFFDTLIGKNPKTSEYKLRKEGKQFAKALYAGINTGGPLEVLDKINQLRSKRQELVAEIPALEKTIKSAGSDSQRQSLSADISVKKQETALLRLVTASAKMQVRNNLANGIREEILRDIEHDDNWTSIISSDLDTDNPDHQRKIRNLGRSLASERIYNAVRFLKAASSEYSRKQILATFEEGEARQNAETLISDLSRLDQQTRETKIFELIRAAERFMIRQCILGDHPKVNPDELGARLVKSVYYPKYEIPIYGYTGFFADAVAGEYSRLKELEVNAVPPSMGEIQEALQLSLAEKPSKKRKWVQPIKRAVVSAALGIAGVLFGPAVKPIAQALELPRLKTEISNVDHNIYQEFSRQVGLEQKTLYRVEKQTESRTETLEYVQDRAFATEMQDIPKEATERCLTPTEVQLAGGNKTIVWGYNFQAKDDQLCEEYFPGAKFAEKSGAREYAITFPETIIVPPEYQDSVYIRNFPMSTETGATCSLTSISSIVNFFRIQRGEKAFQPWVFSDIAQKDTGEKSRNPLLTAPQDKSLSKKEVYDAISSFNDFFLDTDGLAKEYGVVNEKHNRGDIFDRPGDSKTDLANYIDSHELDSAKALYDYYQDLLKKGHIPTLASLVSKEFGHVVTVVGVNYNQETNQYELLVAEPNGGYTGWEYTKGQWKKVGPNGLVVIPLNTHNLRNIVNYDTQYSYREFDPEIDAKETVRKEIEVQVTKFEPVPEAKETTMELPFTDLSYHFQLPTQPISLWDSLKYAWQHS